MKKTMVFGLLLTAVLGSQASFAALKQGEGERCGAVQKQICAEASLATSCSFTIQGVTVIGNNETAPQLLAAAANGSNTQVNYKLEDGNNVAQSVSQGAVCDFAEQQ